LVLLFISSVHCLNQVDFIGRAVGITFTCRKKYNFTASYITWIMLL
jgi:hypothetical protein